MPIKATTTLYQFDELSEHAKERARDWYRFHGIEEEWYEEVFVDAKDVAWELGIDIDEIFFQGFAHQGDGASFDARYTYKPKACEGIRGYAPRDKKLHAIADALDEIQQPYDGKLTASVKHGQGYAHAYAADIEIDLDDEQRSFEPFSPFTGEANEGDRRAYEAIRETLRDFMNWIFEQLREQYFYRISEEGVDEQLEESDELFDARGRRRSLKFFDSHQAA